MMTTFVIAEISETFRYPPFWCEKGKFIASSKVFILFNIRCTLGGVSEYFAISHSNNVTALIATTQYYSRYLC